MDFEITGNSASNAIWWQVPADHSESIKAASLVFVADPDATEVAVFHGTRDVYRVRRPAKRWTAELTQEEYDWLATGAHNKIGRGIAAKAMEVHHG